MTNSFKRGDLVVPANSELVPASCKGRVFKVDKVPGGSRTKYGCTAEDGGRGINFPGSLLMPATDENIAASKAVGVPFVPREFFAEGEVVTLVNAWRDWSTTRPLVVLKDGGRRVNVVPLGGGAEGSYLRVPPTGLVKRDLEWLTERLVDEA